MNEDHYNYILHYNVFFVILIFFLFPCDYLIIIIIIFELDNYYYITEFIKLQLSWFLYQIYVQDNLLNYFKIFIYLFI